MPVVTGIARDKRSTPGRPRVQLSLDGDVWASCGDGLVAEFRLYRGLELSEAQIEQLRARIAETEGLAWCHATIARRALTERGLFDKLRERGYDEQLAQSLVDRCRELRLVDDARYARSFAAGRVRRGHGARRIAADLHQRGIGREVAQQALDALGDEELGEAGADVLLAACGAALAKKFRHADLADAAVRAKAQRFLLGRGFSYDQVGEALRRARA